MNSVATKNENIGYVEGWANFAEQAGLVPQGTNKYQAMAIVQAGKEMGLQPLQSLGTMSFIKGRLVMSVQLQLALAKNTKGVIVSEMAEGEGVCRVTLRRGEESVTCEYTLDDAQKAGLVKPDGSWHKYGRQMLRWRAIGDALRIICPDLAMGLLSPEEAENIETFVPPLSKHSEKPAVSKPKEKANGNTEPVPAIAFTGIKEITVKKGANNSSRYRIAGESDSYYTFDEKFATLAKTAKENGIQVQIKYESDQFGNKIAGLDLIEPINLENGDIEVVDA